MAPADRADFDAQLGPEGSPLIGEADEVAEKILRHSETLGGISRITFQMNAASLPQAKMMRAEIETRSALASLRVVQAASHQILNSGCLARLRATNGQMTFTSVIVRGYSSAAPASASASP